MADFNVGQQPCDKYDPQMESNGYAIWENVHECFCGRSVGKHCEKMVSFCENCYQDHHEGGHEACQCGGKGFE